MPGMYVTYDGRVETADPDNVRIDWERRLSIAIGRSFELTSNPRVAIGGQPEIGRKGHYTWSQIAIQVQQLSDARIELHEGDLLDVVLEQLQPVVFPDAQIEVEYVRFVEATAPSP